VTLEIKIDYSERAANLTIGPPSSEVKERADAMIREGSLKETIADFRAERAEYVKKIEEIDSILKSLESRLNGKHGVTAQTMVIHNAEFVNTGIAEAAVTMIRRAQRPLHVKEIAEGLEAGGYKFKADNPLNSVGPVLFLADKHHKHGVVSKGKNTYSIKEIEDKRN
jgi:hypothetical protein